jgi:hypothetical protein
MSFQGYIDNIEAKTGMLPADFAEAAKKKGLLVPETKATEVTDWLKADFDLGHGHAMAIYKTLKDSDAFGDGR